ncbi:glycosyltransferase [Deinococcus sedimenti]|nr:glycosyltransferase [Deinococcus sedimenti]
MKSIKFSAIIIHYKNSPLTLECIDSVRQAMTDSKIKGEIIIVDNSSDFSYKDQEDIIYIDPKRNTGFSKANNLGIINSSGEVVILLNNDAFMTTEALVLGLDYLSHHSGAGIWAPELVYADGRAQNSSAPLPTLFNLIDEYLFFNRARKLLNFFLGKSSLPQPFVVESLIGACWFINRKAINDIGLLDEDFFFTSEDVDYSYRMKSQGYQLIMDKRVRIIHLGSASQDHFRWYKDSNLHEGRKLYFYKTGSKKIYSIASKVIDTGINIRRLLDVKNKCRN